VASPWPVPAICGFDVRRGVVDRVGGGGHRVYRRVMEPCSAGQNTQPSTRCWNAWAAKAAVIDWAVAAAAGVAGETK